jgi:hypothetical protein
MSSAVDLYSLRQVFGLRRVAATVRHLLQGGGGGIRPFFQGLTPTLLGIVPYSGTTWLCYETLKDYADLFPGGGSSSTTNKVTRTRTSCCVGDAKGQHTHNHNLTPLRRCYVAWLLGCLDRA